MVCTPFSLKPPWNWFSPKDVRSPSPLAKLTLSLLLDLSMSIPSCSIPSTVSQYSPLPLAPESSMFRDTLLAWQLCTLPVYSFIGCNLASRSLWSSPTGISLVPDPELHPCTFPLKPAAQARQRFLPLLLAWVVKSSDLQVRDALFLYCVNLWVTARDPQGPRGSVMPAPGAHTIRGPMAHPRAAGKACRCCDRPG